MLEIRHLSATIGERKILSDITLSFETGKTYALLGPNGSGKSTLAAAILGRPDIVFSENTEISFENSSITTLDTHKRARLGLFLSFQSPPALPGISVSALLRHALPTEKAIDIRSRAQTYASELDISKSLLSRGLYDGFSGGERKKFETLLWAMLRPKIALFDELDTGVDVDAQKKIASFLKKYREPEQCFVFITHSLSLLETFFPDETIVLGEGRVMKTGNGALSKTILQEEGFEESARTNTLQATPR